MTPTEPPSRRVAELWIYPFKSAGGIAVASAEVDTVGLVDDRRWMAVDAGGSFVSQRTRPRMALLRTELRESSLAVSAPGLEPLLLPRSQPDPRDFGLHRVWFTDRYAVDCGDEAASWISRFLGAPSRIVRSVHPDGSPPVAADGRVRAGFADASPALAISRASLAELNRRLEHPLPMDRFRPNLVLEGFGPFEEDAWGQCTIGDVRTRGGRPCPRCATTLVDQESAERGVEPLRTLATFRRNADGEVIFGMNLRFDAPGVLRVGAPIV